MPPGLLDSQIATLESTELEHDVIELNIDPPVERNVNRFIELGIPDMPDFAPKNRLHIGLIGVGVMGANFAGRITQMGYRMHVYERDPALREAAVRDLPKTVTCHSSLSSLIEATESPRCLMLLIKAGKPVDAVLDELTALLNTSDVVVDVSSWSNAN